MKSISQTEPPSKSSTPGHEQETAGSYYPHAQTAPPSKPEAYSYYDTAPATLPKGYYEPIQAVDQLFVRLKAIEEQRAALAKQMEELAKQEQQIIAQIRGNIQAQRKSLTEIEKRMERFEPKPAPTVEPPVIPAERK
jgi:hypothetical protein